MSKFKLLVITSIEQRLGGGAAIQHSVLDFDNQEEADIAHTRITDAMPNSEKLTRATVTRSIKLY